MFNKKVDWQEDAAQIGELIANRVPIILKDEGWDEFTEDQKANFISQFTNQIQEKNSSEN